MTSSQAQTSRLYDLLSDGKPHRIWMPVTGYEKLYFISDDGFVARHYKNGRYKLVSQAITKLYKRVCLSKNNIRENKTVHRIVSSAFIPNPDNKPYVNHIDGDKFNNKVSNLEWVTYSENNAHAFRKGLRSAQGENNGQSKLKEDEVLLIRSSNQSNMQLFEMFNVAENTILNIRNGKRWKHIL